MSDLLLGIAVVVVACFAAYFATTRIAREWRPRERNVLGVVVLALIVLYIVHVWDNPSLAAWLPFANLIVIGNWLPVAASVLAALAWCDRRYSMRRRCVPVLSLTGVAGYSLLAPLLGDAPACYDRWDKHGFCVQTAPSTCGAACAATLLRMHGIDTTEAEMANLCLTREGTTWKGLYRGLKLMTEGTPWDVEVIHGGPMNIDQLPGPALICVGLETGNQESRLYEQEFGLMPGRTHSVILLSIVRNDCVWVADPAPDVGKEVWTMEMLRDVWQQPSMRLVQRLDRVVE